MTFFKEFTDTEELDVIVFNECSFWMQLLGVPIGLSTKNVARILGAKAGTVLEVEQRNSRAGPGKGLKVKCPD